MGFTDEDLEEEDAAQAEESQGIIKSVKDFIRRNAPGSNDVQELTHEERDEIIRILRKSADFRRDDEVERLMYLFRHIDFPQLIRIPGINIKEELEELLRKMYYRRIKAGSYVYKMDDFADSVFIVLGGEVDVDEFQVGSDQGSAKAARTAGPGDVFGEDAGEGHEVPRKRTGMALTVEDTHLAGLDRVQINRLYNQTVEKQGDLMKQRFSSEATGHLRGFFSGWEFIKEVDGVRVYKKTHPTSNMRFFKGIGFVDKPHEEVADYILDFDNRVDWDPLYMKGRVIEQIDPYNCVRHEAFYTPSPLHYNRDMLSLYSTFRDNEAGEHYGICSAIRSVKVKEKSGFVRAECFDTGFQVKADPKKPDEVSQVTFITQVDPGGNYPSWLTDKVNEEQATYISNIRRAMTRLLTSHKVKTILLDKGMIFCIKTTFAEQLLDLWAFNHKNLNEVMSMYRTRRNNKKIIPEVGDYLFSNLGNRMLSVVEDSYGDQNRYVNKTYSYRPYTESDAEEHHQACSDHLHEQLMTYGLSPPCIPLPWPLFCDVKNSGLEYTCLPSSAGEGECLKLKALMDVVIVVGSCSCCTDEQQADEALINISSSLKYWPPMKF